MSRDFWSRPVFRLFVTMASWNSAADIAGVDRALHLVGKWKLGGNLISIR